MRFTGGGDEQKRRTYGGAAGGKAPGSEAGIHTEGPQARDAQRDEACLLLYVVVSGSGSAGADLEEAQTSTGGPSREGREDLPYLPEAMASGVRPEEL